ncbi:ABC transporter ATP-binding protein [Rugosimonospora africana]|uniref:ABC transporter ATP-binding protein n=1 Tax=Rugosimonospora africana TaxID=556532 RepID=A0A8J3QY51_9ACTN|nr:ATP-binding cassette domain-containing protein [Rugosimonospora africana]GIH18419.1 ABC transporter ATP-binding protein [Rugosimonospora africana]
MGIEVVVEGLTKSFGRQQVWRDVSLTLPAGEVSVMLGPSGTGKTVFLKSLVGLVRPDRGRVLIDGVDIASCREKQLYRTRRLMGVMFQDGALFGSMSLYDNVAFPLREHTRLGERDVRRIVEEKMAMVGLAGDGPKLPGEISGGMRKRAGLARALVLDPQIILVDEPDSGLDPVRTAYISQLLIDLNAQIDATILIVTHNIQMARTVPDNIGMLFRRNLVTFGPREVLLTSDEPAVAQFLGGRREGPIGMAEEKDDATVELELTGAGGIGDRAGEDRAGGDPARIGDRPGIGDGPGPGDRAGIGDGPGRGARAGGDRAGGDRAGIPPQLTPTPGLPERQAVNRRMDRVMRDLHLLPRAAQAGILAGLTDADRARYGIYRRDAIRAGES